MAFTDTEQTPMDSTPHDTDATRRAFAHRASTDLPALDRTTASLLARLTLIDQRGWTDLVAVELLEYIRGTLIPIPTGVQM